MESNFNMERFQWNIERLQIKKNLHLENNSFKPKIALIDSGIDYKHTEFNGKINLNDSYNFANGNQDITDNLGHGTMVAGIICAENVIQGCYSNVELIVYKITDNLSYDVSKLLRAMNHSIKSKVNLINLSLSIPFDKLSEELIELFCEVFDRANKNNVIIVIAAGNQNKKLSKNFTTKYKNVFLIGASNSNGLKSSYSNFGAVDFIAPGGDWNQSEFSLDDPILTCYPTHLTTMDPLNNNLGIPKGYCISYGTSIAAAHVTGCIAYLMANYFKLTNSIFNTEYLYSILCNNKSNNQQPHYSFHGEINLFKSLNSIYNRT